METGPLGFRPNEKRRLVLVRVRLRNYQRARLRQSPPLPSARRVSPRERVAFRRTLRPTNQPEFGIKEAGVARMNENHSLETVPSGRSGDGDPVNTTPSVVVEAIRSSEECPLRHGPARVEELDRATCKRGGHLTNWARVWRHLPAGRRPLPDLAAPGDERGAAVAPFRGAADLRGSRGCPGRVARR